MKLFDPNKIQISNEEDDDRYHNLDYIQEVLEGNDEGELKKVQEVQGWSDGQVELFGQFAKLRREAIGVCSSELEERKKNGTPPSDEELSMGAFVEVIEPQVRDTVLALRRKGYNSFESGFYDFDTQEIGFENNVLERYSPSEDLVDSLEKEKVELIVEADSISLKFREFRDIGIIKELWERVEKDLPDLGREAEQAEIQGAEMFRRKYVNFEYTEKGEQG